MANTTKPRADQVLDILLSLSADDLQTVLQVAREYSDHPSIKGVTGIKMGDRLLRQLEFGLSELRGGNHATNHIDRS